MFIVCYSCWHYVFVLLLDFFFFFKQKTAYEVRISDWSSDVCSSDLTKVRRGHQLRLVIPGPSKAPSVRRDEKLVMLIAETHAARTLLSSNPGRSIAAIAASAGKCRTRQPASLPARDLLNADRSEEHTSELQSLMRISYAVFCLTKKIKYDNIYTKLYMT